MIAGFHVDGPFPSRVTGCPDARGPASDRLVAVTPRCTVGLYFPCPELVST